TRYFGSRCRLSRCMYPLRRRRPRLDSVNKSHILEFEDAVLRPKYATRGRYIRAYSLGFFVGRDLRLPKPSRLSSTEMLPPPTVASARQAAPSESGNSYKCTARMPPLL